MPSVGHVCIPHAPITPGTARGGVRNADLGPYKMHRIEREEPAQILL